MNVFVLSTGRTGTLSLEKACGHIHNFTCSHESRCKFVGDERLNFPDQHIEIDNRLSWFLGRLENKFGKNAVYIHMVRDTDAVAKSYSKRWNRETSIVRAFGYGILKRQEHEINDPLEISRDYVNTVNENIRAFLKDKPNTLTFHLENAEEDFRKFWNLIGAKGNYEQAVSSLLDRHNTSQESSKIQEEPIGKFLRVIKKLPAFIRNA